MSAKLFAYNWDPESCPLYGVERWPRNRGFLSTILTGNACRLVSAIDRVGRSSGVAVKRGSTVFCGVNYMFNNNIISLVTIHNYTS